MNLKQIFDMQKEFDAQHFPELAEIATEEQDRVQILSFLTLGALGELGEFANILKKVIRHDYNLEMVDEQLSEEIVDTFIYLVKICQQMNIDLETHYVKKMEKNADRFVIKKSAD